jgi:guanine nucleotide-binding protein subunit alpha, other
MAQLMVDVELGPSDPYPPEYLEPIKQLWVDGGVRQAIAHGNEFALHDNLD